jgi:chemotaxis protein MotB
MAADKKKQTIVIKKITIVAGGHGGSWKVALADFMTALMCFFLVMWLLGQSAETKKAVSDYFSSPSIIEYNFQNFGAEITLEKLFIDLVNEPLKAFQSFMEPVEQTPNVMDFSSSKVVTAFMRDKMGDVSSEFRVSSDAVEFEIADSKLFVAGTAEPNAEYVKVMEKLKAVTTGLEDSTVEVTSWLFAQSVKDSNADLASRVAQQRVDMIGKKVDASFAHPTNDLKTSIEVKDKKNFVEGQSQRPIGFIHISIKQKSVKSDGKKYQPLNTSYGKGGSSDMTVYDSFVKQAVEQGNPKK